MEKQQNGSEQAPPGWIKRFQRLLFERGQKPSDDDILECFNVTTPSAITRYLAGQRKLKAEQAQRLAEYFGVTVDWLLNGPADGSPELAEEYLRQQELRELDEQAQKQQAVG